MNIQDGDSWVEYAVRKARRARRLALKLKHKQRDRYHGKPGRQDHFVGRWAWLRRWEPDCTFSRRKAPTALGFGVAYERRHDVG